MSLARAILYSLPKVFNVVVVPVALVTLLWLGVIEALHLPAYLAKTPMSAYRYLFSSLGSGVHRHIMLVALGVTMRDAALGFIAGMALGLSVAYGINLFRTLRQAAMPFAIAARAVPLVAMTPLIALLFGYNLFSITVVGAIVVFFPTFVTVAGALESLPRGSEDLVTVFGGTRFKYLIYVGAPGTVTALFAAARIAAPGAVLGAVFAEWLISGKGLGYMMVTASETSAFDELWLAVWLVAVVSIMLYNVFGQIGGVVEARRVGGVNQAVS